MQMPGLSGLGGPPVGIGPGAGAGVQRGPFAPPAAAPQGPSVTARLPPGLSFPPGTLLRGKVTGEEGGSFLLQLGDQTVRAKSLVPLEVGKPLMFQVQGEKGGQLQLQLLERPTTPLSRVDLAEALMHSHFPASEENVELARSMVEHGMPVTKESLSMLKGMLAQTEGSPAPVPTRVGATQFLQSNNLPVTPQNVNVLANFLTTNPQVGTQLMALQTEFKRLVESPVAQQNRAIELLSEVPGLLGELVLDPNRQASQKQSSKRLKDLAREMGIESRLGPGAGPEDEDWNLVALMRQMRTSLEPEAERTGLTTALALMKGLEENLEAHQLINQARTAEQFGYFYLQVPLPLREGDTAEIWIRYRKERDGSRTVDREDTTIELLVCTEHLGELTFTLDLAGDTVHLDLGTPSEEVRQFAERYLPALAERVRSLGWTPGRVGATFRPFTGRREVVTREDFESMERYNVQG
ncbi:MAG: flagellar hook-length control protein FliK [Candidatus Eremiobacterota bacterium]